jgi:hypothetical protein
MKKKREGQAKSDFATCVLDMAKLTRGSVDTPQQACSNLSKRHVQGKKRTPYSVCVTGGSALLQDQSQQSTG